MLWEHTRRSARARVLSSSTPVSCSRDQHSPARLIRGYWSCSIGMGSIPSTRQSASTCSSKRLLIREAERLGFGDDDDRVASFEHLALADVLAFAVDLKEIRTELLARNVEFVVDQFVVARVDPGFEIRHL